MTKYKWLTLFVGPLFPAELCDSQSSGKVGDFDGNCEFLELSRWAIQGILRLHCESNCIFGMEFIWDTQSEMLEWNRLENSFGILNVNIEWYWILGYWNWDIEWYWDIEIGILNDIEILKLGYWMILRYWNWDINVNIEWYWILGYWNWDFEYWDIEIGILNDIDIPYQMK